MTRVWAGLLLVAVWILLWGEVSVANAVGGVAVVVVLFLVFPPALQAQHIRIHPWGVVRLFTHFATDVVVSNLLLIRVVLAPMSRIERGVLAVPLPGCSYSLMRFVAHLTALTPGTMAVELHADPFTMYVHVLTLGDVERTRRGVIRLNERVVRAFGTAEQIQELEASSSGAPIGGTS